MAPATRENVYLMDGVNITNIQNGGVGKNFQMEFIEEVQIKSSSFEAEFGGALGGVINAVPKRGSNEWHGALLTYLSQQCAQRQQYATGTLDAPTRLLPSLNHDDPARTAVPEYFMANKDQRTIVEPGYQIGGPLSKNRLWMFSSYIPSIDTTRRTTTFTGAQSRPADSDPDYDQHNAYNRLDYGVTNSLRVFGAWNYAYSAHDRHARRRGQPSGQ